MGVKTLQTLFLVADGRTGEAEGGDEFLFSEAGEHVLIFTAGKGLWDSCLHHVSRWMGHPLGGVVLNRTRAFATGTPTRDESLTPSRGRVSDRLDGGCAR